METTRVYWQMNEEAVYDEMLFSHKKTRKSYHLWQHEWIWRHYAKRNKSEKNKYYMISLICEIGREKSKNTTYPQLIEKDKNSWSINIWDDGYELNLLG